MTDAAALIPAALGGALMTLSSGWTLYERVRYYREYGRPLPEGALPLPLDETWVAMKQELIGSTFVIGAGDPGRNALASQLILTANNGLGDHIASGLLIQNDLAQLRQFQATLPPEFAGGIGYASVPDFAGGHANRSVRETLASIGEWGGPIAQATHEAIYRQLAAGARAPGLVIAHASLGGHAATIVPALKLVRDRWPNTVMVVTLPMPRFDLQRRRFLELKPLLDELCRVDAWLVRDNLAGGNVTDLDFGLVALQVGLTEAAAYDEQGTNPVNAFSLATGNRRGTVLIYQVARSYLVSEGWPPPPRRPRRYFVHQSPLVVQLERLLTTLEQGTAQWSVDVPAYQPGAATFDVLLTNVRRADLVGVVDALKEGLQLRATYNPTRTRKGRVPAFGSPNHGLIVASTTARIDPRRPICPLVGVRFTQARDLPNLTRDLVRTPEKRRPVTEDRRALRPARVVKRLPAPQTVTTRSTTEVSHEHQ